MSSFEVDIEANKHSDTSASSVHESQANVIVLESLPDDHKDAGTTAETWIEQHSVLVFGKTWCPFCKDVVEFLSNRLQVETHVVHVDQIQDGAALLQHVQEATQHRTVPVVYIQGKFRGGCDQVKAQVEELERELLPLKQLTSIYSLDGAFLKQSPRSSARNPLFWFPNTVNNRVVRATGLQVFVLAVVSGVFYQEIWARYLAVGLLVDFGLRLVGGSFISPLGMIATVATSPFKPNFKPGAPKQFASSCGLMFSLLGTIFYFWDFQHHEYVGAAFMLGLAGASGMEAFLDFCLGCVFFGIGIRLGLLPDDCYRIHTQSAAEIQDSYNYKMAKQETPEPQFVNTDPSCAVALKYKAKRDEWTKNDFDVVKNMQVGYFAMPLSLVGLATAFRIAATKGLQMHVVHQEWEQAIAVLAAVVMVFFWVLYGIRVITYPYKCLTEWQHPLHSNSFGTITIALIMFAFIVHDELDANKNIMARVLWWVGSVGHAGLTVAKMGEWIGRRLEWEHVHAHYMIMPVGLAVAALVSTTVHPFDPQDSGNAKGNALIARFFQSFALLMWIALFALTFGKVMTDHNSDNRVRHGVWIWLAAPSIFSLSEYSVCTASSNDSEQCFESFCNFYFVALFMCAGLCWSGLPGLNFVSQEPFNFGYWIECFSLSTLAAATCMFNALTGWRISENLQWVTLTAASICSFCALMHVLVGLIQKRDVFTPEVKWGPLSFMLLTHEAIRNNMSTLKHYLQSANVSSASGRQCIYMFAIHFQRFRILHEEHAKHEDKIIFKTFNDYFSDHAKKWNDDHAEDHIKLDRWIGLTNGLLNSTLSEAERQKSLSQLQVEIMEWLKHFEEHLRGEENHLNPIGKKHIPLALMKQMSRQVWESTPASRWEVIVPFIVNNLPRHPQRVRYMKVLTWSMPEQAQQIGAIVYRNTDAVTWERLVREVPEIIPRGAPGWRRFY